MATDFNTHYSAVNELTAHNINAPTMDHNDNKSLDSPLIDNDLNDLERGVDDYLNDDFRLNYCLNKIVLVNSASHAYSEIPIDEPLVLLGKNNRGKTSSLAATKLFYILKLILITVKANLTLRTKQMIPTARKSLTNIIFQSVNLLSP